MRAPFTWLVVAVGILLVIVAAAAIGNRDKSGETVTAGEWAQSVCGAVGVWRGELESVVEDIRTPSSAAPSGEEPQSETPQGRTGLVRSGLERAVQATETMVEGIDNAGIPDTEQGEESAEQVASWADDSLNDLEEADESLDEEAETLEEAVEQLTGALATIGSVIASGVQTIADVALDDPELANALRDASTCDELREEAGEQ
jgi:hypothetical protein